VTESRRILTAAQRMSLLRFRKKHRIHRRTVSLSDDQLDALARLPRPQLGYFYYEEEPGWRSAVKLPRLGIAVLAFGLTTPNQASKCGLAALPINCGLSRKAAPTRAGGNVGHHSGLGSKYRTLADR
jgi:hypothetical protein